MIQLRNLDPSLIQWIMNLTGLGPGIGEIKYVAPATSSTSQYRTQLESMGVSSGDIYTLPSLAYAAMEAYRNDVMLVMPGTYTETASIAWNKQNTHLIGCGGEGIGGDQYEPNVLIYTTTASIATLLNITAGNCTFSNFAVMNNGNNAANLASMTVATYSCTFKNVNISGVVNAGQDDVVAAACLYIGSAYNLIFDNCIIGQNVLDAREGALSGVLRLTATSSPPQNVTFRDCKFLSASETVTCAMVAIPANYACGRGWLFDNCHFSNFSVNWGVNLNQVFYDNCGTTHDIMLHHCSAIGIDEWQDADAGNNYIGADMPICGTGGGLARNPTAGTGN